MFIPSCFCPCVLGSLHGLVFLPVLLSLVGPPSLLRRKKGWITFFSAVDGDGVDDDHWTTNKEESDVSMQHARATAHQREGEKEIE